MRDEAPGDGPDPDEAGATPAEGADSEAGPPPAGPDPAAPGATPAASALGPALDPEDLRTLTAGTYIALGGIALLIRWAAGLPWPRWNPSGEVALQGLAAGLAVHLSSRALMPRFESGRRLTAALGGLFRNAGPGDILFLAAVSGVIEEFLFRGVLLSWWGPFGSLLAFIIVHPTPAPGLGALPVFAAAAGAVLTALAVMTGGLTAPAIAHAVINAWNLRWVLVRGGASGPGEDGSGPA